MKGNVLRALASLCAPRLAAPKRESHIFALNVVANVVYYSSKQPSRPAEALDAHLSEISLLGPCVWSLKLTLARLSADWLGQFARLAEVLSKRGTVVIHPDAALANTFVEIIATRGTDSPSDTTQNIHLCKYALS